MNSMQEAQTTIDVTEASLRKYAFLQAFFLTMEIGVRHSFI